MQGVYIKHVSIDHALCFASGQHVSLVNAAGAPAKWNVILGDNGTGKTSLLQLLATLDMDVIGEDSQGRIGYSPAADIFIPRDTDVEFTIDGNVEVELALPGDGIHKPITMKFNGFNVLVLSIHHEPSFELLKCYGYGATRIMAPTSLLDTNQTGGNAASLFEENVPLINAEEWLLKLNYSAKAANAEEVRIFFESRRAIVLEVLLSLLPDVEEIRFVEPTKDRIDPRVQFKTYMGWLSIDDLSLGYKTMIAWTVDLAYRLFDRYPNSGNPLAEPAVVLIDEIDLHLHPKWQRNIFTYLGNIFSATQFIVTAHSPLIVQALPGDANLILLKRENDRVVIDQNVENVRHWRIDQILSSELFEIPVRNEEAEQMLEKRRQLMAKANRTQEEELALAQLQEFANSLPNMESDVDRRARDFIRKAAEILKQDDSFKHLDL